MRLSQTSLLGKSTYSLHEPEATRIQRDSETITHRLEVEKRIGFALDETIKELTKKLSAKQREVESTINWKKVEHKDQYKLKLLENNLGATKTKLSEIKSQNKNLRDQIELMRRNKRSTLMHTHSLLTEITKTSSTAALHASTAEKFKKREGHSRSRMMSMKDVIESDRNNFTDRLSHLESIIVADKKAHSDIIKNFSQPDIKHEVTDGVRLIRMLAEKWLSKSKDKKKTLEKYREHTQIMIKAVGLMSEHSGIQDITNLAISVINSFDHTKDLEGYMIKIHESIGELEHELLVCNSRMNLMKNHKDFSETERSKILTTKSTSLVNVKLTVSSKSNQLVNIRTQLSVLKEPLISVIKDMNSLDIKTSTSMFMEEDIELTERNFKPLINTLEETLTHFLISLKKMRNSSNPLLAMIDLDKIIAKDMKKTQIGSFLDTEMQTFEDDHHILSSKEMRRRAAVEYSNMASTIEMARLSI